MSVGKICRRPACTVMGLETARSASERMTQEGVGALVVVEGSRPVGLLTDRDLVVRVVATGRRAGDTRVADVATLPVVTLVEDVSLQNAATEMGARGARRMPVVDAQGHLLGLLAADDLVRLVSQELTALADVASEQSPRGRRTLPTSASELRDSAHYARPTVSVGETDSASDVARAMHREGVGCVIVVDEAGRPRGMLTDRDLVGRVTAPDLDPSTTTAAELIGGPLLTIEASEPLQQVVAMMSHNGIRRIPVVRGGELFGIITYDDVIVALGRELCDLGEAVQRARRREARSR